MFARVALLGLLSFTCAGDEPPTAAPSPAAGGPKAAEPPFEAPVIVESAALASEPKAAEPPPAPEAAKPADAASQDLTPRLAGATGPDAELFSRAEALRKQGDVMKMRQALLELLRDHPASPLVPHVYLTLGDESFKRGEMKNALQFFEKALSFPNDDVAAYALHLAGWCRMNLGEDEEALAAFVQAAERATRVATDQGRALARASILDSAFVYVRVGKLDKAPAFYAKATKGTGVTPDEALRRMATAAIDSERRDELARLCKTEGMPAWCAGPLDRP
ncbi:tetratricopeptide repeat protein [Nannocystis sp. SCPEA4]|uniref:tetratricopeptide repeat protein n=1 Tax=Nannocystis sp. SCPEA4 TaxID=2996787 RepID=UPI002271FEBC|nr:tetratricopeptide repeat protein [Nannocystis sp. SCPEA4]MCY1056683.1 tetratricopeptide repeat protein [Nannocystis sp. SCPEA4]